jgi:hypothetical protein
MYYYQLDDFLGPFTERMAQEGNALALHFIESAPMRYG